MDLSVLCRDETEILNRLRIRGVTNYEELTELTESDVNQLGLKDLVVRRRLLRAVSSAPKKSVQVKNLEELCNNHTKTITTLHQHGVRSLEDLRELEAEDIEQIKLINLVIVRRLLRFISKEIGVEQRVRPRWSTMNLSETQKTQPRSPIRISMSDSDVRAKSPKRASTPATKQ